MFYNIQILRAIACLGIVYLHTYTLLITETNCILNRFIDWFFIISGFIITWKLNTLINFNYSEILKFFKRRFLKIYLNVIIINICGYLLLKLILPESAGSTLKQFFLSSLNLFKRSIPENYLFANFWSLSYELWFYLTMLFYSLTFKKHYFKLIILHAIATIIFINTNLIFNFDYSDTLKLILPYFLSDFNLLLLLGCNLYNAFYEYKYSLISKILIVFSLFTFCHIQHHTNIEYIKSISSYLMLMYLLRQITNNNILSRFLINIGNASFSIYITHFALIFILIIYFKIDYNIFNFVMLYITSIITGICYYKHIKNIHRKI